MKREIDVLMDTYKLKQEFKHDKRFSMAIKSFVKREWKTTYHFLKHFHDLTYMKYCKDKREWWFPQNDWTYTFRNREFKVNDIFGKSSCVNTPKNCSMVMRNTVIKKK